ncbi:unnamed protein product [Paramecium sonneborni]|uniref:EGF-like domain-containing protein n=1 Tax=Paramecium sonneborni TaxID=65129 RepID=A0A8S1Q847_9CILI|nr:unnamed protein product [Paramecium sonneborni]
MIFTLLTTLLCLALGAETSQLEPFKIKTENILLDWSSRTISIDQNNLILTQHFRTYESLYQTELILLDIQNNKQIKRVLVGNQDKQNYHPQIILINKFIYIVYVNQDLSIVKLKIKKYDLALVEQQVEHTLGDSLENAKFDKKMIYIKLTTLSNTTFSIFWKSRGQSLNEYQWNYIKYDTTSDSTSNTLTFPDSLDISIAQNQLGIIGIVQLSKYNMNLTKIVNDQITDQIQTKCPAVVYDTTGISIISLPNNEFVIWQNNFFYIFIRFDQNLQQKSYPYSFNNQDGDCINQNLKSFFYLDEYNLYFVNQGYYQLCLFHLDLSNQNFDLIQNRKILKKNFYNEILSQSIDKLDFNKLSIKWLTYFNYEYELNSINLDMNIKQNQCKQNCKLCDPQFKCLTCLEGYTLINVKNECVPKCPENCDFCINPSYCTKCKVGFQYSSDNLCITPQDNFNDLIISDEQVPKGKVKLQVIDNEFLILYSLLDNLKQTQIILKKFNSQGVQIKQIMIEQQPSLILDFDVSTGYDLSSFHILIKWLTVDSIVQIIDYTYDMETFQLLNQITLNVQSQILDGNNQIKIVQLKDYGVGYFYLTFDEQNQYYQFNYLRMENDQIAYEYKLFSNSRELISLETSVDQNIIYFNFTTTEIFYSFKVEINQINPIDSFYLQQNSEQAYQNFYKQNSISIFTSYDEYLNKQIFMNFTETFPPKLLQVSQSRRNLKDFTFKKFGDESLIFVWQAYSNVEQQNPTYQIYIQSVNLKKQELANMKEMICSKNCVSCADQLCLQCQSTKYQLENGKCLLTCESNCQLCEIENQCLQCVDGYYLNEYLICDQTQSQQIYWQDNYIYSYIASYNESVYQVSIKKNNSKYDVIFEEFNRQGQSQSGEILVSSDLDYLIIPVRPKLIKVNNLIVIQYLTKDTSNQNCLKFVILDDSYLLYNSFQTQAPLYSLENLIDIIITDDLIMHVVYLSYYYDYWQGEYVNIQYQQFLVGKARAEVALNQKSLQNIKIDKQQKFRNLQIMKNSFLSKITFSFIQIEDNIETLKIMSFNPNRLYHEEVQQLNLQEKFEYYLNANRIWIVSYEKVNSHLVKVKFYNENQEIKQEHIIETQNQLSSFQIQLQNQQIYFIYTEQMITSNYMNIQIMKFSLNGDNLASRQIYNSELIIQDLTSSSSEDMIYLTWSSFNNNRIFKVRLNTQLNTIPFVEQICKMNCEICDKNQVCQQCSIGYNYSELENKCVPICAENCQQCSKPYTCDFCNGNFKYINQNCTDITNLDLETSICEKSCYGLPSMIVFTDSTKIISFQKFEDSQYKININKYNTNLQTVELDQNLISQTQEIAYHLLYQQQNNIIALVWLTGACKIQCRLMIQLFQQDLSVMTNPYELRIMKVEVNQFNLKISQFNNDLLLLWTEIDTLGNSQTLLGQYNIQNGFSLKMNINENSGDVAQFPNLIVQSGYYQIVYLKNNYIINALIVDGSVNSYRELYKSTKQITSLAVGGSPYYGICAIWVELEDYGFTLSNNGVFVKWFDQNLNVARQEYLILSSSYRISQLTINQYESQMQFFITIVIQEFDGQQRLRYKYLPYFYHEIRQYGLEQFLPINVLSQFTADYGYRILMNSDLVNILFQGVLSQTQQLFYYDVNYYYLNEPQDNCFQKNSKNECQLCKQGFYLFENECEIQLPNHCADGDDGICEVCNAGYMLTIDNICVLENLKYKEMKMNTYQLQSKQRITTFKNGDYVISWYRKYYENQGTGVFMSMFNAQGKKILDETRISLSSAGIQIYPDVQSFDNDQFCAVWIEGDLQVQGKIKMQRFTKDFVRIGEEIVVSENIQLKYAQRFDTPILIQSIVNGYVIVWTQNHFESNILVQKLHVNFYDLQDNQKATFVLNNQESIKNSEPVITSNNEIIVIVWQSDLGIIASKFSLNYVYISQEILSSNGQAPSISTLSDNKFIIAWRETAINSLGIMNQNIIFRKYTSDLSTYLFSNQIAIPNHNMNNPDVIAIHNGFAIIFENRHSMMSDLRNIKMQLFNLDGLYISQIIDVFNEWNIYPHHPQLTALPQGEFLASWTQSQLSLASLNDDIYMKRYNSYGIQLPLDTVVCPENCKQCNENAICLICMNDYVLFNSVCYSSIPHCTSYATDSIELKCQTCDTDYKLVSNICFQISKYQQLNVEFVNDISSKFSIIQFQNNDILFIWIQDGQIKSQKFDQYGNQYSAPKNITGYDAFRQNQVFDACALENNKYLIAFISDFSQHIIFEVYDFSETLLQRSEHHTGVYLAFRQNLLQLKYLGNNQVAIFYQGAYSLQYDQQYTIFMEVFKCYAQYNGFSIEFNQQIKVLQPQTQFYTQSIDVEIINNQIDVGLENDLKSEIRYLYKTYDFYGNLVKILTKNNDDYQVEFKILELENGALLEVWTEIVYSKYEVYYVIKLNNKNLFEPKKLSISSELYKLDLKTHLLSDSIIVIWREGSFKYDMTVNTKYNAVFISKQNYQQVTNPIQLNSVDVVKQGQKNFLRLIQLRNLDIVIGWISYNYQADLNVISAAKLSSEGKVLEFSKFRCSIGCQECTNQGICLQCYNNDKYILTADGNCMIKNGKCQNYQSDCQICLNGYYQNRYLECNEVQQNMESDILFTNGWVEQNYQRIASYKNGTFIIAQYNSETSLGIRVFNKEAILTRDYQMILEMTQDTLISYYQRIMDFEVIIDDNDVLTFSYITGFSSYWIQYTKIVIEQYDNQLIRIGSQKEMNFEKTVNYVYKPIITLKILQNNIIGMAINMEQNIILSLHNSDFSELIGNTMINMIRASQTFDFSLNGDYAIFGYVMDYCDFLYQQCSVIKVYNKYLSFIKDIIINDGLNLKITKNLLNQFIVLTKSQINVIDKTAIIKSQTINYQSALPLQLFTNENDEIVILALVDTQTYIQNKILLLLYFNNNGQLRTEVQVNMKNGAFLIQKLFILQNSDVSIVFTGQSQHNENQFRLARFDQFGKSLSTSLIICPQNCEACFQSTSCNICKPGYNRNAQTLLCEKICTIDGCQSCEQTDCDICKDGMFFNFDGKCVALIQDPSIDANLRYSIDQQFNSEIKKKVLKFSNNEFALVYASEVAIFIRKFNAQGQELMYADLNVSPMIQSFDATIVNNYIYIAIVSIQNPQSYQIYGFGETSSSLIYLFENYVQNSIQSISIKGFKYNYVILVSFLQDYYDFGYMQCLTQSLYFYNEQNQLFDSLLNYNNPSLLTSEECNQNKIKSLYIYEEMLYIVITKFTSVRVITLNSVAYFLGEYIFDLPNLENIELAIDSEQIVILYQFTGSQSWNLRIYNTQFEILLTQENYLRGDLNVNMVSTSSGIVLAWSQKKQQSVVEFAVLNKQGSKIKSDYIKGQYSLIPLLTLLDNQIVCLVWNVWTNQQLWSLSYSLIDSNGLLIQMTQVICPQNCIQCSDSSNCQQCEVGSELIQYFKEPNIPYSYCVRKCDTFCSICYNGKCERCQRNYYVDQSGVCVLNEFENKAIQINEFTEFSQITPDAAKFKDGSILIAWTSNNEDEDSWGIFAQLLNNQGQKVGNNFRVSQSVFGAQHSPQVVVLEDDTAIISFIEGNPEKEAMIKGLRFNNKLEIVGNEQLFTTFSVDYFVLNQYFINKIVSLKNGGFAIIWQSKNQINTQFYDSASNLVLQTTIVDVRYSGQLEIAITTTELAILYKNIQDRFSVCVYTQDGVIISNQEILDWNEIKAYQLNLISIQNYFALAAIVAMPDQQQVKLQLYNNQFSPAGNPIVITENSNQLYYYDYYQEIELFSLNDGALLILSVNRNIVKNYRQFYIDINWQVTELLPFGFNTQEYYFSQFRRIHAISNINTDQYFIIWSGFSQDIEYYYFDRLRTLEATNIYIQRVSKQSQLVPIDQIVCSKNCVNCDTQKTCSQCLNSFQLQNQQCIPQCESNCLFCITPKICEVCSEGYYQKVQGKCSPIPFNYHEAELLMNYPLQSFIIEMDLLSNGQTIIYTQQTLYDQQKEIFSLYIFQNNEMVKQVTVLTNTITNSYYRISPFYIEDNYYLIFHMVDGIKIIKFNAQQEEVLNKFLPFGSQFDYIATYSTVFNLVENNQYSLLFYQENRGVYRILYDEEFNVIQQELIFENTYMWYGSGRTKNQLYIQQNSEKYTFTNSLVIEQSKQNCLYSEIEKYSSCQIFQLSNGNKIQIVHGTQSLQYYGIYGQEMKSQAFYRILDNQDVPITSEAIILDNTFSRQSLASVFVFQDSFTILIEQPNYYTYENVEVYAQRFDNSGMKIGEPQLITFNKGWQSKFYKQTSNGFIVFQEFRIYDSNLPDSSQIATIYYKQYDTQGNVVVWSTKKNCIDNCDKCINSYYCEECSVNYELDQSYKCKLTCQSNCNQCSSFTICEVCDAGYKLENGLCTKIVCTNNCAQCMENTTSPTGTICTMCDTNYYLSSDSQQCLPQCPSNCSQCNIPLECETCAFGYIITTDKKCQQENSSILDQIKNTTVGTPLVATFPDGSYILLWYQNGENAGVYFQLYSPDNVKVGDPMKVTQNTRRLLSQQSIIQDYYADLIAIDYEFFVTWMDASAEQTDVNLKKFSSDGTSQSENILLGSHKKTDLQEIKLPCQIKKTNNNSLLIAYMAKSENEDYSMFISSYDSALNSKTNVQEIKKVNKLAAPSIVQDENGIISLTYQSDGYVFVQQITQDGNLIDSPKAIADSDSIILRVTNLNNGIMVFLWENKNLQLSQPQFNLNYQLISKDLKTRSEVKSVGDIQIASLTPDIQSFNEGFIIAWKITDNNYKSIGLQFQIFDSLGISSTQITEVEIEGIYPQTPRIQIINENQFAVTWTAKNIDSDGTILGDGIFMQKYNKYGTLITDSSSSTDLCSYQCQSCQSPLVCLKCQYGFYLDINNQCIMDCGAFCDSCEIPWTCQVCKNGYQLNSNDACIETECPQGYFRNINNKLCEPECPDECNECTVPNICATCKSGYSLSDSSCISSTVMELDDQSTIMAIVIIILAAAFVSVSACSITLYCKYKKLLKEPSHCQVHPIQDINKSVTASCNASVIRLRQNE